MANHKSAIKRIRQSNTRRLRNRYYHTSMRTAVRKLRSETDKEKAQEELVKVSSMIDRVAKRGIIHKNKASNLKSKLAKHINSL